MPQVALTYSSSKVDGLTASTNNQPSVVGEGWDLQSGGFIERRYRSCADDGVTPKTGDLCWAYDNATVTLACKASELIRDDGTKVEKLTSTTNGDNDGEHWKLTTIDGTQYFFGLNRLPGWTSGKPETASAWTVPVYGDDSGEPCNAQDWCRQAWRWNLDYVVDPNGNAATYWYSKESNNYNRKLLTVTAYDRSGYAQRSDTLFTVQTPARAAFGMAERCLPDGNFDCAESKFTTANATKWPDTPADLNCPSTCTGKRSPSFWTRKRLTGVTTQMYSGSGTDYADKVSPAMVSDLNYGYDTAGNITSITDKANTTDSQCFQYDYLRRLTEAWAQGSEGCATTPAQSVVGGPAPYWTSFGNDVTGNRTSEVRHAASGDTSRTYSYPAAGASRPHGVTAISGGDAYTYSSGSQFGVF
ncbi:hypothetical protein [Herbidospora yilanensis]|uniref:hypothetical protein n=1 Tax=Herbidospora yilanensis TaxID=354426 RepID=UPI0007849867|nr:hypothetical protein [Herbidospora yilanensis]